MSKLEELSNAKHAHDQKKGAEGEKGRMPDSLLSTLPLTPDPSTPPPLSLPLSLVACVHATPELTYEHGGGRPCSYPAADPDCTDELLAEGFESLLRTVRPIHCHAPTHPVINRPRGFTWGEGLGASTPATTWESKAADRCQPVAFFPPAEDPHTPPSTPME